MHKLRPYVRTSINALVLAAIIVASVLLICEVGLRVYLAYCIRDEAVFKRLAPLPWVAEKGLRKELMTWRPIGYTEDLTPQYRNGANVHNSLGFRGNEVVNPKPEGEFRIACLGDSTTYGEGVADWHEAWPAVLETILRGRGYRVTVVNAGAPAFTSQDAMQKFQTVVIHLKPDMVLYRGAINDLFQLGRWPKDVSRPLRRFRYNEFYSLWDHSAICSVLRQCFQSVDSRACIEFPDGTKAYDLLKCALGQAKEGTYPSGIFKSVSLKHVFENSADFTNCFADNLRSIAAIALCRHITPILMNFPLNADLISTPQSCKEIDRLIVDGIGEFDNAARRAAKESGALFFDLAQAMPKDRKYFVDMCNNNEDGQRVRAELIADFIISKQDNVPRI